MAICVPDASVLLKWVIPAEEEPYADAAVAIRDAFVAGDLDLLVPSLWLFEVGNTLVRKYPMQAQVLIETLATLQIPEAPMTGQWRGITLGLAVRNRTTFYDAAYHALAMTQNGVFVTADEKYLERVKPEPHARHLREWAATP
ncbi:MAG: type II toxin-antitoxin system VapC family toxin [Gammaproteobacteria bacterium]